MFLVMLQKILQLPCFVESLFKHAWLIIPKLLYYMLLMFVDQSELTKWIPEEELIKSLYDRQDRSFLNAEISGPDGIDSEFGEQSSEITLFSALLGNDGISKPNLQKGMTEILFNCVTNVNVSYSKIIYGNK